MELLDEVNDLSEVGSEWQGLYTQADNGIWRLGKPEDTSGLKSALSKEREARKKLEKDMRKVDNPDEELKALRSEVETLKTEKIENGVKKTLRMDALKAGVKEEHVNDVVSLTRGLFNINDDGEIATEDGKSPAKFFSGQYKKDRPVFYKGPGKSGSAAFASLGKRHPKGDDELFEEARKNNDLETMVMLKNKNRRL